MCVCMCLHPGDQVGQTWASDPLKLDLQMVLKQLIWWDQNLCSLEEQQVLLTTELPLQPPKARFWEKFPNLGKSQNTVEENMCVWFGFNVI